MWIESDLLLILCMRNNIELPPSVNELATQLSPAHAANQIGSIDVESGETPIPMVH